MIDRALAALGRHPGRLVVWLLAAFAVLAACDSYFAFSGHPRIPALEPLVSLTGSRGLPAFVSGGLILLACLVAIRIARGQQGRFQRVGVSAGVLAPAALLLMIGVIDVSRFKPVHLTGYAMTALVGGVLVYGALRFMGWPVAARVYGAAGLLLLATNPLTNWLELWLAGNSDYYAFDATTQTYVFDPAAWHLLWAVSRAQELSELVALACFLAALLAIAGASQPAPSVRTAQHSAQVGGAACSPSGAHAEAERVSVTGDRQQ